MSSGTDKKPTKVVNNTVYVGNLAWEVKWQDLKDHMSEVGEVIRADVLKRPDGKSKGGGLVRFATAEAAEKAIKELTNTYLMGRQIFVREDREAGKSKPYKQVESKSSTTTATPTKTYKTTTTTTTTTTTATAKGTEEISVYVGNIPWHTQWQTIKDLFSKYKVLHVDVGELRNGRSRGWAIIKFGKADEAEAAIKAMNGYNLEGREIAVRYDNKK
mmetsp:Transcript_17445/g.26164  ORF Transcript_17445/g.26164 Transcript_17445/m.26164 type:complete len:216 (+) Transcript_17445:56-703(+)